MTLSEFLLARIAEDEAVAQSASPGPWHTNAECDEVFAVDGVTVAEGFALSGPQTRATTVHIARHDPARVLAECEAKRRIMELCEYAHERGQGPGSYLDRCVALLALPYADHEAYQEEWRPMT
jgi:hypothetical protein